MTAQDANRQPDITVFRGWADSGKYVWSPYVIKLELRLRFTGVRYSTDAGSPRTAPKGKIPYIECRDLFSSSAIEQRTQLSDSALIGKTLTEWGVLPDLNGALAPPERTHDMALRALLEDKLYFYHTWERWIQNYYTMRDKVLWSIPYPVRIIVGLLIYRSTTATLHGQGTGRFTGDEIAAFRREIWESLNALLGASRAKSRSGGEPFWVLGGEQPTEADTTLFGFVVSALICNAGPDSQKVVRDFPIILDYASRIHDRYFPDYEKWNV
ncbi:putative glutathione S-transferase [Whalleya microplaca]|nr:putative glutathione S-transferase [Whalleya microplaca]